MSQHLHLKFAVNLETLADEMIEEISKAWTSPFDAPVVIFSEYKLEQWFRLHWIEKKGILANLNRKSLDRFLMDILVGDDPSKKKLTSDMLRNVILAYLQESNEDGVPHYKTLDDRVSEYLVDPLSGRVDENRLFDFANKLSGLFLEYETSRPSGFLGGVDGFLDCWKQGALKDFFLNAKGKPVENEAWERKLYSAIFHNENGDSLLTKVFKSAGNPENPVEFLTLPFLYHMNRQDGKMKFHYDSTKPVFILGLSGMGQFYRVVLQEFAKEHDVYAYIQNPCMEFWEDIENPNSKRSIAPVYSTETDPDADVEDGVPENENVLLVNWGRAGRDNIKLWSLADDYAQGFDDAVTSLYQKEKSGVPDSLLHEVQWMIAHRTNQFSEGFVFNPEDSSLTITSAPSKIREVEAVHSQICKLLEEGANVRDILVVSPKMAEYRTAIYQVFDQSEKTTENGVHLRFVILDSAQKKSLLGEALEVLFAIRKKGALARDDFFTFVRNPIVQAVKRISPEEVSKWEAWVRDMNIYRDHTAASNAKDDWLYGVHRMLLARLSDSFVLGGSEEFLPYANIDSEGKYSLNRFADVVLALEDWICKVKKPLVQKASDNQFSIATFQEFLNGFFLMSDAPEGLAGESIIYNGVIQAIDELNYQFATGIPEISWNIVTQTVQCAAMGAEYSCGNLFVGGISFMKFAPNRTIPVKHLFFLGANAKDFPGSKSFDTLDLRKSVSRWPGDDTPVEKNRYAFLCQLMSTSESLHISYQNMYLPKDQELFPSSVVNDLRSFLKKAVNDPSVKILPDRKISIDEDRPIGELYTEREVRNKKTVEEFNDGSRVRNFVENVQDQTDAAKKLPERVSAYSFRKFLEDPFQFHANSQMYFDEEEDFTKVSMEPVEWDRLQSSSALKYFVAQKLNIPEDKNNILNKEILRLRGSLPPGEFGEKAWNDLQAFADRIVASILLESSGDWKYSSESFDVNVPRSDGSLWTLVASAKIVAKDSSGNVEILDVTKGSVSISKYLSSYIAALGMIADGRATSPVTLRVYGESLVKGVDMQYQVLRSKEDAVDLLNAMYEKMFVHKFRKIVPIKLLTEKFSNPYELNSLLTVQRGGPWDYFAGRKMFDVKQKEVSGYDDLDNKKFAQEWLDAVKTMKSLMPDFAKAFAPKESSSGKRGKK
ncbi:MAG: exodeoxyribonuclease V subunit gamma [Fibrobacter sp.]|nr:exodeoxyribonuclease V subunit gamma [Fibrobacter sp.]